MMKDRLIGWTTALLVTAASAGAQLPAISPIPSTANTATYPEVRTYSGEDNNLNHPSWGQAGTPLRRTTTVAYDDGTDTPAGPDRPSAREISNLVVASSGLQANSRNYSDYFWQWGQFVDHDLDLSPTADPDEPFPVEVPLGDPFFDPSSTGVMTIGLSRSDYSYVSNVRQQTNVLSSYLDASNVYGSDEATALSLRKLDGSGQLKTSSGRLLPKDQDGFFLAGDVRVNEQVGLTSMHTLFMREHNFWASVIRLAFWNFSDEEIYQLARVIVSAEIQQITYREFLPLLLGPNALPAYSGYKPNVNASIENAFATAAYRFGHSMLSPTLLRLDKYGNPIAQGNLALRDAFFNPAQVSSVGIEPYLRGLAKQRAQELDNEIVDDVRNFLFGNPGEGGFDLASLNIQRGREHGLPSYNQTRLDYGLPARTSFAQISSDPAIQAKLAAAYSSVDQVDLWVGGLAEDHVGGAIVGQTFRTILKDQFKRLRDGDRFWYEGYVPGVLLPLLHEQTLATIIRRNTSIGNEIQDNVFIVP